MILTDQRRDLFLPLSEAGISKLALQRLGSLGVTTLQELRDLWIYGPRELLASYLEDSPVRLLSQPVAAGVARGRDINSPLGTINVAAAGRTPPLVKRTRGAILSATQRRKPAELPDLLPAAGPRRTPGRPKHLIDRFPKARDQGQRGTCVAFASTAFLEYHLSESSETERRSEQFSFWACKQIDKLPSIDGTHVRSALDVLKKKGTCLNKTWIYESFPVGITVHQGPPPKGAEAAALGSRWPKARKLAANNPEKLCKSIDEYQPIVLSVKTFPNWDFPNVESSGEIQMPLPMEYPDGAHAICVVGYEKRLDVPGGGIFIFRNSWGEDWAKQVGRFGGGYGTVYFDYIHKYGMEAFH